MAVPDTNKKPSIWPLRALLLWAGAAVIAGAFAFGRGQADSPPGRPDDEATATTATTTRKVDSTKIVGTITVNEDSDDYTYIDAGEPCFGSSVSSGFDDISPGADVTVKNQTGEIIATGEVGVGKWTDTACEVAFSVNDVPKARFYELEVANRGAQRFSRRELEDQEFRVDLTLG